MTAGQEGQAVQGTTDFYREVHLYDAELVTLVCFVFRAYYQA